VQEVVVARTAGVLAHQPMEELAAAMGMAAFRAAVPGLSQERVALVPLET